MSKRFEKDLYIQRIQLIEFAGTEIIPIISSFQYDKHIRILHHTFSYFHAELRLCFKISRSSLHSLHHAMMIKSKTHQF